ncbi:hypothetical protein PQX77_010217 [Marasmius sp. AFHP31]|nr:hypothetical protein PQX77_010217 [Marasmius sp. AFHP31]
MQDSKNREGYSNFFYSGFRGIYARGSRRRSNASTPSGTPMNTRTPERSPSPSSSPTEPSTPALGRSSSSKRKSIRIPRLPFSFEDSSDPETTRRPSLSHRFIDKLKQASTDATPFRVLRDTRRRLRTSRRNSEESEHGISSDQSSTPQQDSPFRNRPESYQAPSNGLVDPFNSSPNTRSIFVDIPVTPAPTPSRRPFFMRRPSSVNSTRSKRESFLSFGGGTSSPEPEVTIRERPHSVQYSPTWARAPARSRVSSIVKGEFPWSLEEIEDEFEGEQPPSPRASPVEEGDPGDLDWRQFHIEMLNSS